MKPRSIVASKAMALSIRIVRLYQYLKNVKKEYVMSKQLLRSGTSIGANISEAQDAVSKADFINKLSISLKETSESIYWIELLHNTNYLSKREFDSLFKDLKEIKKILNSIIISTKNQIK